MQELLDELPSLRKVSFRNLTRNLVDRIEIVVRFLAVLELFKQGYIELDQPSRFGDISIEWIGDREPAGAIDAIDVYDG